MSASILLDLKDLKPLTVLCVCGRVI